MSRILYNLALHCVAAPLLFSYFVPQILIKGKYRHSISGKLGKLPAGLERINNRNTRIWFHAVSVGEVVALAPLVEKMVSLAPDMEPLISTGTETGQQRAHELIHSAEKFFYMPLDFPFSVKRVVNEIKPDLFIMTETEIWPNLIYELKRSKTKIALINGRISDRSYPRYVKFRRFLQHTLDSIDLFSMCSDEDAYRIAQMGADPGRVSVAGNIKIDSAFKPPVPGIQDGLLRAYDLKDSEKVLVAGSIHPGEDQIIIDSYKDLLKKHPQLVLIIAPRHLERVRTIVNTITDAGFDEPLLKSRLDVTGNRNGNKIIIIDRMGELFDSYSVASVVFVGGSLVSRGGQNILEPAAWSKPVIFGPFMEDFRDSSEVLLKHGAAFRVRNSTELTEKLDILLTNSDKAHEMGRTAHAQLGKHVGSADKTARSLLDLMRKSIKPEKN